ncbi:MAG TPA: ABC transporter permease [Bryobacteraceae bacterium]|jgi:phospholipid/cholesterol/gamma-HCH transport system permease protein
MVNTLTAITEPAIELLAWFGDFGKFCWRVAGTLFKWPFETREFLRQLDGIGSKSLPLVILAGGATGVVLSLQTRDSLARFGAKSMLPAVIFYSLVKETGPIITGLVVSGRVGAGIGAELGSMRVTEQIDAMAVSGVDPEKFLAATRILACFVALPLLTLAADASGILMGWVATTLAEPTSLQLFFNNALSGIRFSDFLPSTFKTALFGLIIGAVSSFQGINTRGGTAGVGRSATSSVVLSSLFIILADVVLVRLIIAIYS